MASPLHWKPFIINLFSNGKHFENRENSVYWIRILAALGNGIQINEHDMANVFYRYINRIDKTFFERDEHNAIKTPENISNPPNTYKQHNHTATEHLKN